MPEVSGLDAYSPHQIAERVEQVGVVKVRLPLVQMAVLGVLAGGFIGLGALYFTLVVSDASLGFAASRVLGGVVFSLGLVLVVVAGAELFTGNNLAVMAWASKLVSTRELLRSWAVVFTANGVGAAGLALMVFLAAPQGLNGGTVAAQAVRLAAAKTALPFEQVFFRAVLCNMLVCLAVWMAMGGRTVADKVLAVIFPISAFVAAGFEHVIANLYFIPLGFLLAPSVPGVDGPTLSGAVRNVVAATVGNVAGGAGMVALVYWLVYRRGAKRSNGGC